MSEIKKINLVTHIHWDPAWYLPYEQYKIQLVDMMDHLLELLETTEGYHSFMLDGQMSMVQDYLEIRSEKREIIKKFVEDKKLFIGPWFIQPEEFMISGESHIMNLKKGIKLANELGGYMPVSYLCDMTGHISTMPQIINGFGLKYYVGSRGIFDSLHRKETEFIWQSSDGSQVLVQNLPTGYNYRPLPQTYEEFKESLEKRVEVLSEYSTQAMVFIPYGDDHTPAVSNIVGFIERYNQACGYDKIIHTDFYSHFKEIKHDNLKVYEGEFRSPDTAILTGILSTRMNIKLKSEETTRSIERYCEPACSIAAMLGAQDPEAFLQRAWDYQLKNAFHDCIYGAHIDAVAQDVHTDYRRAGQITQWLLNQAFYDISQAVDTAGMEYPCFIFNPTMHTYNDSTVELDIFLEGEEAFCPSVTIQGKSLPCQVKNIAPATKFADETNNAAKQLPLKRGFQYQLSVQLPTLPSLGYTVVDVKPGASYQTGGLTIFNNGCENYYLRLFIEEDGTLTVNDKRSGKIYHGLHLFTDGGDKGDCYNYSRPVNDDLITNPQVQITLEENGPCKAVYKIAFDMEVPACCEAEHRSKKMTTNHIETLVTLKSNSPIIEFHTTVINRAQDHKLSITFDTGKEAEFSHAGGHFTIDHRPTKVENHDSQVEQINGSFPHRKFIVTDSFTFADRGLVEYQLSPDGILSVTLLRCIGMLSKNTLKERPWHTAPELATPSAQELGEHTFSYALIFGATKEESMQLADTFYAPPVCFPATVHPGSLPKQKSFISCDNQAVHFSSLRMEEGKWVLRLYNITDQSQQANIYVYGMKNAVLSKLDNTPIQCLQVQNNAVSVLLKQHEICTICITI